METGIIRLLHGEVIEQVIFEQPLSSAGALTLGHNEYVGYSGEGIFNQTGGANTIGKLGSLLVGNNSGSTGTYALSGTGSLSVGAFEVIGLNGSGMFTQSGGTNSAAVMNIGSATNSVGTYAISGGTLTVGGAMTLTGTNCAFSATGGIATVGSVSNAGAVSINSGGALIVNGNYTQTAGSTAVDGLLSVAGQTIISGGTFQLDAGLVGGNIVNNAALSIQGGTSSAPVITGQIRGSGTLTIGAPALAISQHIGVGSVIGASSPAVAAYLQLAAGSGTSSVSALTINAGSTLDITNNTLAINFGSGSDPVESIRTYLQSAYAAGSWTGAGLTSSTVESQVASVKGTTNGAYSIGYSDGTTDGTTGGVQPNQILIAPELVADANLDGKVDFNDLLILAQNNGSITGDWVHADFNFDSKVDFNDLLLLAQNINQTNGTTVLGGELPASFEAQWALAQAEVKAAGVSNPVPEPGTMSLLAVAASGLLARKRRQR